MVQFQSETWLKTQEKLMFQFLMAGKKLISQFEGSQAEGILSYSGEEQQLCSIQVFSGLDEASTSEKAICFTLSANLNANLTQKHPPTKNNV